MTRKKTQAIQIIPPAQPPALTDEQLLRMESIIRDAKRPNPMPWIALFIFLFGAILIGGMMLAFIAGRPEITPYPTQIVVLTHTLNPTLPPTVTRTPTDTPTPDATKTMIADPAWQTIRDYFQRVKVGDYGGAWGTLTSRCRIRECWEAWQGDFQTFKEWWWALGSVEIRRLTPELIGEYESQAFVVLYFKKDELPHNYRFYLLKVDGQWMINRIEYVTIIK